MARRQTVLGRTALRFSHKFGAPRTLVSGGPVPSQFAKITVPSFRKTFSAPALVMAKRKPKPPVDLGRALIEAFLTNERINQVLLESISPAIWRALPPCSKRRNIATSFAHMHNV